MPSKAVSALARDDWRVWLANRACPFQDRRASAIVRSTRKAQWAGETQMTRNDPLGSGLYDEDFYAWTQGQAAALRALPGRAGLDLAPLDIAHLAEEVEDLGRRDLRNVMSYLDLVIQHLVKLRAAPASRDAAHWHAETVNVQRAARRAFSPSMRRLIDVGDVWIGGCRAAGRVLKDAGARDPAADPCPFTLDDLLARNFDVDAAAGRIAAG